MDINTLTLGQMKEIRNMVKIQETSSNILEPLIGSYAIIRSRNEGVNCGVIESADNTGIILSDARRLWYHIPLDKSMAWYEGVAQSGLAEGSKVSTAVSKKAIIEDYSITLCTAIGEKSLREFASHEQS